MFNAVKKGVNFWTVSWWRASSFKIRMQEVNIVISGFQSNRVSNFIYIITCLNQKLVEGQQLSDKNVSGKYSDKQFWKL